jgi:hypothetical protein
MVVLPIDGITDNDTERASNPKWGWAVKHWRDLIFSLFIQRGKIGYRGVALTDPCKRPHRIQLQSAAPCAHRRPLGLDLRLQADGVQKQDHWTRRLKVQGGLKKKQSPLSRC